jgi:hypothetical protein
MVIPTISANDTFGVWQGKINQVIGVVDALTDGVLFVNGSLVFTNSTFSLALQSLNVANNLVLSNPSGNALFLLSSNIAANGTLFSTGSGIGLSIANSGFIGKNLSVGGVTTLNTANANSISAGTLFDNGNRVITNLTINTANGIIESGAIAGPGGTITISQILIDNVVSNITTQAATGNAVNTVYTAALLKSVGGVINSANSPWSAQNLGKQLILTSPGGNNNPALGFTDINGANLWAISAEAGTLQFSAMPNINDTTSPSNTILTLSNTGVIVSNITVSSIEISSNANVTYSLTANTLNTKNEIISTLGPNSNAQFRGVFTGTTGAANNAVLFRNDGTNFFIATTGTVVDPYHAFWNTQRPFAFNMSTGAVTIDAAGAGVTFGGSATLSVGSLVTAAGLSFNQQSIVMPNGQWYWGKDSSGTAHAMIGYSTDNHVFVWCGTSGLEFVNSTASAGLATLDNSGNFSLLSGNMSTNQNCVLAVNNRYLYGTDASAIQHPIIGYNASNQVDIYGGSAGLRFLRTDGFLLGLLDIAGDLTLDGALTLGTNATINGEVLTNALLVNNTAVIGNAIVNQNAQIGTYLSVGGVAQIGTTGVIQAYYGYLCKNGISGVFGLNSFNLFWNGSSVNIFIDNSLIASFQPGTSISDARTKENIKNAPKGALKAIRQLRPITFNLKKTELLKDYDRELLGWLAHEVQPIIPHAVTGEKDAVDENGDIVLQTLDDRAILVRTTQALVELADKHDELQKKYNALEKRLLALEKHIGG